MATTVRYALESPIEGKVVEGAKRLGVVGLKLNGRGQNGWPDRIFLIPGGKPLLIEFKRPGGIPRPLQVHRIETLTNLAYDVEVHDDSEEALRSIKSACERAASRAASERSPP